MASRFNLRVIAALFIIVAATAVTPAESVATTFQIEKTVEFGQGFVVAGNVSALGNWSPIAAPLLTVTATSAGGVSVWTVIVVRLCSQVFYFVERMGPSLKLGRVECWVKPLRLWPHTFEL